ncbi:MAG: hypothetical protein HFI05_11390 [Lachnospiraceae bacterium]|nr:hypothetical protein [Lachnospiraceae bacterium]
MKRWKGFLCVIVLSFFMVGCGEKEQEFAPSKDTIYVKEDGSILEVAFDMLDKEYYSSQEMESFVNEEVRNYNLKKVEEIIKIEKVEVQEKEVSAYLTYTKGEAYAEFNKADFYSGTIKGAMDAGYEFQNTFLNYADGTEVSLAKAVENSEDKIIVYMPDTDSDIRVDGKISYISDNVVKIDEKNVSLIKGELSYIIYK